MSGASADSRIGLNLHGLPARLWQVVGVDLSALYLKDVMSSSLIERECEPFPDGSFFSFMSWHSRKWVILFHMDMITLNLFFLSFFLLNKSSCTIVKSLTGCLWYKGLMLEGKNDQNTGSHSKLSYSCWRQNFGKEETLSFNITLL